VDWIELSVVVEATRQGETERAMEELGAMAVTSRDAGDHPVLEPAPGETPLWPRVRVTGLYDARRRRSELEAGLWQQLGETLDADWQALETRDWSRAWMDRFEVQRFGRRLAIVPSHLDAPDDATCPVFLDPGLAFGTGTHPTTALCLERLEALDLDGAAILDYGCGSGILAIAALKLGAARAVGVDIDPQALVATRENARRNGVEDRLEAVGTEHLTGTFDVVVANILAGPLVALADPLSERCRPGGRLLLSGLLVAQADPVSAAYGERFGPFRRASREDWLLLEATRRSA